MKAIQPSIFYSRLTQLRVVGCWSLSQLSLGEKPGIHWTGRQSITGLMNFSGKTYEVVAEELTSNLEEVSAWLYVYKLSTPEC